MARRPSAAVPARSVSARMDVDTDRTIAANAAETHRTVSSAPPVWSRRRLLVVIVVQLIEKTIYIQRSSDGDDRQPVGIGSRRSHLDAHCRRHGGRTPLTDPATS